MKRFFLCTLTAVLMALVLLPFNAAADNQQITPVKYVFLFIGDGMSMPQRMLAEEYSKKITGQGLFINSMTNQAPTRTNSASNFVTDSAASGTAIACGEKTRNESIGVDAEGKRNLESIAVVAKKSGRKVGIITSVTINHATPASFYAHNVSRSAYYNIALDMLKSDFDYFGGGGAAAHNNQNANGYIGDIYELAAKAGYTIARGKEEIMAVKPGTPKVWAVGSSGYMPYAIDREEGALKLADFVEQAISLLDNPNGFFIMTEGGMIDTVCHSNDAGTTLRETLDFDRAVRVAYEFALKHPDETLIVVTGDHETGGLTLGFANTAYESHMEYLTLQKCSIDRLTLLIEELGKNKEVVTFDDIKPIIRNYFSMYFPGDTKPEGMTLDLNEGEIKKLQEAFARQFPEGKNKGGNAVAFQIIRCFNTKCALEWTTGSHTAMPVLTSAYGKCSWMFTGLLDNTDISKLLKQVVR